MFEFLFFIWEVGRSGSCGTCSKHASAKDSRFKIQCTCPKHVLFGAPLAARLGQVWVYFHFSGTLSLFLTPHVHTFSLEAFLRSENLCLIHVQHASLNNIDFEFEFGIIPHNDLIITNVKLVTTGELLMLCDTPVQSHLVPGFQNYREIESISSELEAIIIITTKTCEARYFSV